LSRPPASNASRWAADLQQRKKGALNNRVKEGVEKHMEEIIEYKYSPEFVKKVYREYWLRKIGVAFALSALLASFGLISFLRGNRGIFEGVVLTLFALYLITIVRGEKQAEKQAKALPNPTITVTFNDEGITFDNVDHISIVKWRRFESITKLKSAWLFFIYSRDTYTAIPTALISNSIKVLIEKKMAENHRLIQ